MHGEALKNPVEIMKEVGGNKYANDILKAKQGNRISETRAGTQLLREGIKVLTDEIQHFRRKRTAPKANKTTFQHSANIAVKGLPSDLLAMLTLRVLIDNIAHSQNYAKTAYNVGAEIENELLGRHIKKTEPELFKELKRQLKYTGEGRTRQSYRRAAKDQGLWVAWDSRTKRVVGTVMVECAIESTGFFEIKRTLVRKKAQKWLECKPEVLQWLEDGHLHHAELAATKLPLVSPPAPWVDQWTGGFPERDPSVQHDDQGEEAPPTAPPCA